MTRIAKGLAVVFLGALGMGLFYFGSNLVADLKFLHSARLQNDRTVALKQAIQEQQASAPPKAQTPAPGGGQ